VHGELYEDDEGEILSISNPNLQDIEDVDREDECPFSKECIESVSGAELEYRQIRCCRRQQSPQSCPPTAWKDNYQNCEVYKKNLNLAPHYRSLGPEARKRNGQTWLPFGGFV
jgi:hypothetical protein